MYARHLALSKNINNLYIGGRLADFKYYYMDQAVLKALELYEVMMAQERRSL